MPSREEYLGILKRAVTWWCFSGDTGISSKTIVAVALNVPWPWGYHATQRQDAPYDPSDFGRCYRLLKSIPELREMAFPVLRRRPEWKGLVENWDELTKVYLRDLPTGRSAELYEMIDFLRRDYSQPANSQRGQ